MKTKTIEKKIEQAVEHTMKHYGNTIRDLAEYDTKTNKTKEEILKEFEAIAEELFDGEVYYGYRGVYEDTVESIKDFISQAIDKAVEEVIKDIKSRSVNRFGAYDCEERLKIFESELDTVKELHSREEKMKQNKKKVNYTEKDLWKLCSMVEKRIKKWETIEGYPPISATDVCAMVLETIKTKEEKL